MYAFGDNFYCSLGIENEDVIERPIAHPFFKAIGNGNDDGDDNEYRYRQIECGEYHSGVIDADWNVFLFGSNVCGQIGMGWVDIVKVHQPFKITAFKCKQISIGYYHTLMLTGNDEVYACGDNRNSECFQMESGDESDVELVLPPTLCTREAMGIADEQKYGNVARVIAGNSNSFIVVEQV